MKAYHESSVLQAIPADYGISSDQRSTIADRSFAASERAVYIVTVFSSILAAIVLAVKNGRIDLALYVTFFFGLIGVLGVLWLHSKQLDYFDAKWHGIRRGWIVTALLIIMDSVLIFVIVGSSLIPRIM
jgi:hypothetical protein